MKVTKVLAVSKKIIEANPDLAGQLLWELLFSDSPPASASVTLHRSPEAQVLSDTRRAGPWLVLPVDELDRFTDQEPLADPAQGRAFVRGIIKAAGDVWALRLQQKLDFDRERFRFRRPWGVRGPLSEQTVVFWLPGSDSDMDSDLLLHAYGREREGLPRTFELEKLGTLHSQALQRIIRALAAAPAAAPVAPFVTTLSQPQAPYWLSFHQWMDRLEGTPQGTFVKAQIAGPQRIEGPAGSGKTLSLVLKCLHSLQQARKNGTPFHAAFIVFGDATKERVVNSFFLPLDEDGYWRTSREEALQSVSVTTLLEWSTHELRDVADRYELPAKDPSQARKDQLALVDEVRREHVPRLLAKQQAVLSQELRRDLTGPAEIATAMLHHEFGVVVKGMADSDLQKYLLVSRPAIGLTCLTEADRRFVFALFGEYCKTLEAYGYVDLDDVAVSHVKLLQMPLRRKRRESLAFDAVFVDEAHSFNPNELAVLFLLVRQSDNPPLVIAVDLPQALADKNYRNGGLDSILLQGLEPHMRLADKVTFSDVFRSSQEVLDLAASVYAQGQRFFAPLQIPGALRSAVKVHGRTATAHAFKSRQSMLDGVLGVADRLAGDLGCKRSDVLIVALTPELFEQIPSRLLGCSNQLLQRSDWQPEQMARRTNRFVVATPDVVHGLEFEGVVLVGATAGEVPRLAPERTGAAALFETQAFVDRLYLALTRARRGVAITYDRELSPLLSEAVRSGRLNVASEPA